MLDAAIEFHAALLQIGELLQPCLAVRLGDGDVVDRHGMPIMVHSAGGAGRFGFSISAMSWWLMAPPP